MARDLNVDFSICRADLTDFRGQILGNLVLNVKEQDAPKVLDYLRRAGCIAEEGN